MAMSWDDCRKCVGDKCRETYPMLNCYCEDMYGSTEAGEAIMEMMPKQAPMVGMSMDSGSAGMGASGKPELWKIPFSMTDKGECTLGEPEKVRKSTDYVKFARRGSDVIDFRFADTATYPFEEKDGLYAIRGIPIFRIGFVRDGFSYDAAWGQQLVANMAAAKASRGYRPTVIKGHTGPGKEPESEAFVENIRVQGDEVLSDFVDIPPELFADLQAGKWPYRSVEVLPSAAELSAVALLGGSMPYHKFPPLAFTSGVDARWFGWTPDGYGVDATPEEDEVKNIHFNQGTGGGNAPKPGESAPAPTVEAVDPVQFAAVEGRLTQTEKDLATEREENRKNRIEKFQRTLRDAGFTPAVIEAPAMVAFVERFSQPDQVVRFSATEEAKGLDALGRLVTLFAEQAKAGALMAPKGGSVAESTTPGAPPAGDSGAKFAMTEEETERFSANADPETVKMDRFIRRVSTAKKIDYAAAATLVRKGAISEAEVIEMEKGVAR